MARAPIAVAVLAVLTACCNEAMPEAIAGQCPIAAAPPDAGPMLVFEPNPVLMEIPSLFGEAELQVTSLSGNAGPLALDFQVTGGGLSCSLYDNSSFSGPMDRVLLECKAASPQVTLLSLSANQAGTTVTVQPVTDGAQPTCTSLGEPCGLDGDCCAGLSCQATDGGCACLYAWPH